MIAATIAFAFTAVPSRFAALDKTIGIAEYAVPARRMCADLAKLTGVKLTCSPVISEDLVVLVVKARPAKEILAKVASVFGWQWVPADGGFELEATDEFTRRAANGRYPILAEEAVRRQTAAKEMLAQLRGVDAGAIQKQIQDTQSKMNGDMTNGNFSRDMDQITDLNQRLNPATGIALAALADLDVEQMVRLCDHRMVAGTNPGPLEIPLGDGGLKALQACVAAVHRAPQKEGEIATVTINGAGFGYSGPWMFGDVVGADVQLDSWSHASVIVHTSNRQDFPLAQITLPKPKPPKLAPLAPALQAELTKDAGDPAHNPNPTSSEESDPLEYFANWLESVAQRQGCDLVSDAYDEYLANQNQGTPIFQAIPEARAEGFNPVMAAGWLENRNLEWPRWREEEAPRDVIRELSGSATLIPIDDRAALAARMTIPQLKSPLTPVQPSDYWFYRFWSSLTAPVRDELRRGKRIRVSEFPTVVVEYLYEAGEHPVETKSRQTSFSWGDGGPFSEPDFVDYGRIVRQIHPEDDLETGADLTPVQWPPRDNDFAWLYPSGVDPNATVWMQAVDLPGIFDADSRTAYAPGELANLQGPENPSPIADSKHLKLTRSRAFRLHVGIRDGAEVQADAAETIVGDDVSTDRTKWPKDLLDRIERRVQIQKQLDGVFSPQTPPP